MKLAYLYKKEKGKVIMIDSGDFYDMRAKYKAIRGGLERVETEDGMIYFNATSNYTKKVKVGTLAPVAQVKEPVKEQPAKAPKAKAKAKAKARKST